MILKTLTHDRGNSDCWNYYSGIQNASVFFKDDKIKCIAISGPDFEGEVVLELTGPAYLCDDLGQTIEKVGLRRYNQNYKKLESADVEVES